MGILLLEDCKFKPGVQYVDVRQSFEVDDDHHKNSLTITIVTILVTLTQICKYAIV